MTKEWPKGMLLSREAFDLAEAGKLEEAAAKYAEASQELAPEHYWSPSSRGEYASVLSRLGRTHEALLQYERALVEELRQHGDEAAPPVILARCFLADHLVQGGDPARALDAVRPAIGSGGSLESFAHSIQALALAALGRQEEARAAASKAMLIAQSDGQRARIRERLGPLVEQ